MKKNLSYREKLLELSKIYKVSEIQNYIKNKKYLTTSQLEHILRKNNIAIPSDLNTNFVKRNLFKPLTKAGSKVIKERLLYGDDYTIVNNGGANIAELKTELLSMFRLGRQTKIEHLNTILENAEELLG